jgi:hypothetical protein
VEAELVEQLNQLHILLEEERGILVHFVERSHKNAVA